MENSVYLFYGGFHIGNILLCAPVIHLELWWVTFLSTACTLAWEFLSLLII